jgi:hypothetical protein
MDFIPDVIIDVSEMIMSLVECDVPELQALENYAK